MTHTEALKLVLADIEANIAAVRTSTITAIKEALAQPQQEPVGVVNVEHFRGQKSMENVDFQLMADLPPGQHLVYTFPPQPPVAKPHEQEPVAEYIGECSDGSLVQLYDDVKKGTKFYGIHSDYDTVALRDVAKLYAKYDALYKTQNVSHGMIAGALFDFMGWLTSRPKRIMLSSADEASPAVDAIKDFANMRGLSLDDAQVQTWQEALAQPQQEPVACEWWEHTSPVTGIKDVQNWQLTEADKAAGWIEKPLYTKEQL